jgi:hypothetical protein
MKNIFIQTENSKRFYAAMNEAVNAGSGPVFMTFFGKAGRGKTTTARYFAAQHGWTYCRALSGWTELWMLQDLCRELGMDAAVIPVRKKTAFEAIINHLRINEKIVIIDEADKLSPNLLEWIRDIVDTVQSPFALIGEKLIEIKMKSRQRLWSRTLSTTEFMPITIVDILFFAREASGIVLKPDLGKMIKDATGGDFRLVVRIVGKLEKYLSVKSEDINENHIKKAIKEGLTGKA